MHSGARWAMRCRPGKLSWLAVYLALLGPAQAALAGPQEQSGGFSFPVRHEGPGAFAVPSVPVELVPPAFQEGVRRVLAQPTLAARGPAETFACDPVMYHWLLDNPHHAVHLWKQLGAKTTDVEVRGQGRFGYRDSNGTDIWWETVLNGGGLRVWYSTGVVRPGLLLPKAHVEVVLILQYREGLDDKGHQAVRHQMHLLVKTESRVVALAARMLGASAPKLAEQYMGQMQMFFGALAWYLDQDDDRARRLFKAVGLYLPPRPQGAVKAGP